MIKKLLFFGAMLTLSSVYPSVVLASSATSNVGVRMKITNANCIVNSGKGISGVYSLPQLNDSGNVIDRISYTDVPLIIDCTKGVKLGALTISFTEATSGFQNAANGLVNTTMKNIALLTRWKRNGTSVIDLSGTTDILMIKDSEIQPGVYDSSFKVYPVMLNGGTKLVTPGSYQSNLKINITYY